MQNQGPRQRTSRHDATLWQRTFSGLMAVILTAQMVFSPVSALGTTSGTLDLASLLGTDDVQTTQVEAVADDQTPLRAMLRLKTRSPSTRSPLPRYGTMTKTRQARAPRPTATSSHTSCNTARRTRMPSGPPLMPKTAIFSLPWGLTRSRLTSLLHLSMSRLWIRLTWRALRACPPR